jgi:hypothetical protein
MKQSAKPSAIANGIIQLSYGDETYVYRVYCRCNTLLYVLLYVGMTGDLAARFAGHRRALAPWLRQAERVEWDLYAHRTIAERVEYRTIREQAPLHNLIHALPIARPLPLPWPRFLTDQDQHQRAICAYRGESFLAWLFTTESWGRPA